MLKLVEAESTESVCLSQLRLSVQVNRSHVLFRSGAHNIITVDDSSSISSATASLIVIERYNSASFFITL